MFNKYKNENSTKLKFSRWWDRLLIFFYESRREVHSPCHSQTWELLLSQWAAYKPYQLTNTTQYNII